ncbi:tRNA (adenosine(37)-N6)-dimethylallyltransferase MiaA [Candidatus Allofournierella merdipullorum]|uniref:tRNA (adenosine(37)-N6)-dimethylallyltransferase MiaA n=1 Tax=Candidatus Allofournierella merdipullorum TaxID=2838595 RepID=UPI002A89CF9C|nr:tRNA (adenosine(37)-N6)-dimethylallyltransferase MiaA [Candidatus Fournierella merdipullorum]
MADWDKMPVVAVGGPTASGKTAFSVQLAKRLGGEIVCADSMQIYKGLDVGTAKATKEEMQGVPHHLMDFLPPEETFSVADFVEAANREVKAIAARGKLPILVGGTGLYIESFLNGVRFAEQKADPALREKLEREAAALGPEAMHQKLAAVDPDYAATVHPNNVGRVVRALELYYATGKTMSRQRAESLPATPPFDSLVFCLAPADRAQLYRRIDLRVDRMLEAGILEEAKLVFKNRDRYRTAAQAIGYKEFFPYFEGTAELAACADKLKQASRNYAKRQLTWFRRMENVIWLDPGDETILQQAETTVREHFGL